MGKRPHKGFSSLFLIFLLGLTFGAILGWNWSSRSPPGAITLTMIYGSEKRGWIDSISDDFQEYWEKNYPDHPLTLTLKPLGSREAMTGILAGEIEPVIWSPASSIWIPLANWFWEEEYNETLIENWEPLVFSPIIIGTWEDYADQHNIFGFQSLHDFAISPGNDLKYAHTDPHLSNSGFMAVILEVTVAAGKNNSKYLTLDDLRNNSTKEWLTELESKAVYYGESTGFLAEQAVEVGPNGLNVFIIYENLIIEKNMAGEPLARWGQKFKAVYPEEGTLLSDHPFCILNAPWVTKDQQWAAEEFLKFLMRPEIQKEIYRQMNATSKRHV